MPVVLSFIVIARNEAATIVQCLESTFEAADAARLASFEVIYVDSGSTDGSVSMVRQRFGDTVRTFTLTGYRNAGVARNVGATVSKGKTLFFIDGDMVVDRTFLNHALGSNHELIHPVVTGQLPEKIYDSDRRQVGEVPDRRKISRRGYRANLGGVFLIGREVFEGVGGFAPELRVNEDLDLGLRLAQSGASPLAIPFPIATHHTIEYFDRSRIFSMVRDGSMLYPGVVFRRHVTNRHYLPILLAHQRPTMVLAGSLVLALVAQPAWLAAYVAYVGVKNLRRPNVSFLQDLLGTTARSAGFLAGLVGFYPHRIPAGSISFAADSVCPANAGS